MDSNVNHLLLYQREREKCGGWILQRYMKHVKWICYLPANITSLIHNYAFLPSNHLGVWRSLRKLAKFHMA
ncbi:hypothetical protein BO85DRAFT_2167 [Aspergillus piperis CBS 112811]|uniref:Uncharacterized protein n=1 Tax=Aspergillus piperis CBS 112811 TaxID=1448313 RepID=A0A8G1RBB2_9EURO|nr:hypothetical protein BO85DRAFT_2167 [Aspergillus piperis CBS 112811]RAH62552.1 hypothetical protein BO85DRAFT_2167 [Aspergillus piperis CBS 112811]